jgi:enamine deaminase RidA (YjgF/YER057c/UK114 family)
MPIFDITLVGGGDADPSRIADACAAILNAERGHTWVRVHRMARADYGENGVSDPPSPVFVDLVLRELPDDRAALATALTDAIARELGRSSEDVHLALAPGVSGRIAFGGELVHGPRTRQASSGAKWEAIVGYSRAVRVDAHVWVTGTTSFGERGEPTGEGDAYAQAKQCIANIERALSAVGARASDVVRTRMFVTDIDRDWEAIGRAHAEAFGSVRPATTMVEVKKLIEPWMLVEIEADAYVRG